MNNNSIRHVPNTLESVILSKSFSKNLDRKYIQVDGKGIGLELFLIIKSNNFVLLYDTPYEHIYYCCDTVTYGLWKFENDHKNILLNTPAAWNTKRIEVDVKEITTKDNDSITFNISNPIERDLHNQTNSSRCLNI